MEENSLVGDWLGPYADPSLEYAFAAGELLLYGKGRRKGMTTENFEARKRAR